MLEELAYQLDAGNLEPGVLTSKLKGLAALTGMSERTILYRWSALRRFDPDAIIG